MSEVLAREVAELSMTVKAMAENNSRDHNEVVKRLDGLTDEVVAAGKIAAANGETMKQNTSSVKDHEERIRLLEKWQRWLVGVGTGAGAMIGSMGALLFDIWSSMRS